jgi:hypothetical protein
MDLPCISSSLYSNFVDYDLQRLARLIAPKPPRRQEEEDRGLTLIGCPCKLMDMAASGPASSYHFVEFVQIMIWAVMKLYNSSFLQAKMIEALEGRKRNRRTKGTMIPSV